MEILDVLDDHSRLLVGSSARTVFKAADVVTDLHQAMNRYGRPERLLTDNGAVFTGLPRGEGWVALEREATALGIKLSHSRPYHPTTCGKVERCHQTVKKWLARQPRPRTVAALQAQLDAFAVYYNTARPHRGIGRRTPSKAFAARPKAGPRHGVLIDEHYRVRRDRVDPSGVVTIRHNSRLHHIGLGRRHAGARVSYCSFTTSTSASRPKTPASCCAPSPSTPPATTRPRPTPPPDPGSRETPRRPQPGSRLAEHHPKGTGLDPGKNGATLNQPGSGH